VSHNLDAQIEFELDQLRKLLAEGETLVAASALEPPDATGWWALGAMLQAFCNGIENILKRIAAAYDGKPEKSGQWHIDLLARMAKPGADRPAVISAALLDTLKQYLAFRHVFRSIYTHELRWENMEVLVRVCSKTLDMVEDELRLFLTSIEQR
jgi:hypothetical protein